MNINSTAEDTPERMFDIVILTLSYSLTVMIPTNTYVLWLILQENRLAPDIFYFNLSLEEVLFSLSAIFFYLGYKCIPCLETFMSLRGLFFTARPLFQCLICLECYMGVNQPMMFLHLKPLRYRLTCCAVCWLLVAFSCIYSYCTYTNMLHLFTIFTQNLLFLFVVLFCLVSVLQTLQRPSPGEKIAQKKSNKAKNRAFKILSVTMANMTINFLLCMVPIPLQLCLPQWKFVWILTICTFTSFVIGSMLPLIYLQRTEKILCLHLH